MNRGTPRKLSSDSLAHVGHGHVLRVVDYSISRNLHFVEFIEPIEQNGGQNCLYLRKR